MFSVFPYIFSFNDIIIHFTEFSNKCQTNPVCFRKFSGKIYLDKFPLYPQLKISDRDLIKSESIKKRTPQKVLFVSTVILLN